MSSLPPLNCPSLEAACGDTRGRYDLIQLADLASRIADLAGGGGVKGRGHVYLHCWSIKAADELVPISVGSLNTAKR